jgi:hypothetical protein
MCGKVSALKGWHMKKILLTVAFFMASMMLVGHLPAQQVKGPKLEAAEVKYDFGKVIEGAQASHVFEIRNAGNELLVIDRVVPS